MLIHVSVLILLLLLYLKILQHLITIWSAPISTIRHKWRIYTSLHSAIISSGNGFIAWLAPIHDLNQCWGIVGWIRENEFQWNFNTLRPRQYCRQFADDIFKCIFLNKNASIWLQISLKLVPNVRINNIPALVQIITRRRPGDEPVSDPMKYSLFMYICVTGPQWGNHTWNIHWGKYI